MKKSRELNVALMNFSQNLNVHEIFSNHYEPGRIRKIFFRYFRCLNSKLFKVGSFNSFFVVIFVYLTGCMTIVWLWATIVALSWYCYKTSIEVNFTLLWIDHSFKCFEPKFCAYGWSIVFIFVKILPINTAYFDWTKMVTSGRGLFV